MAAAIGDDFLERVYAGVLGKIIGVYLGRPVEGWTHERILREIGPIDRYVNEKLGLPIVLSDDDITGTFTFIGALEERGCDANISAEQIGDHWLNSIIEKRTILWWGGVGMSTEHTAFHRLKQGIKAPRSGSIALNGRTVAEQIGAQIFIDGWAMVAPGNPELAASLAKRAASVSHDGEAVHAAQVIAAIEAQAFVERDMQKLLDVATSFIPRDSTIYRMIGELRECRGKTGDWKRAFADIMQAKYGYDRFGGVCHVVPNHGVIILSLLFGEGDFDRTLMIANTCGWDTDCNSGNAGCIMGIRNGLAGIGTKWRAPVNDRMYLPAADGGACISDAASQAIRLTNIGRRMTGVAPITPKEGARFHFSLPGSTQGFSITAVAGALDNRAGRLRATWRGDGPAYVFTPTFVPPDAINMPAYSLVASPTICSGQTLIARVVCERDASAALSIQSYRGHELARHDGPAVTLTAGISTKLRWEIPDTGGEPIVHAGVTLSGGGAAEIESLTWMGEPKLLLRPTPGAMWKRAWLSAADSFDAAGEGFRIIQSEGRGMAMLGTRQWRDYEASAALTPRLCRSFGLAARVQGMRRYYALMLCSDHRARLIRVFDGVTTVLAECDAAFDLDRAYTMELRVSAAHIAGRIDGKELCAGDHAASLDNGAIGLIVEEGHCTTGPVRIIPDPASPR